MNLVKDIPANGLKLDKDLKFEGLVQNVCIYRMESKKI